MKFWVSPLKQCICFWKKSQRKALFTAQVKRSFSLRSSSISTLKKGLEKTQEKALCQRDAFYCLLKWDRCTPVRTGTRVRKLEKSKEKGGKLGLRDVLARWWIRTGKEVWLGSLGEKQEEREHGSKEERWWETVNLGKIQGEKKGGKGEWNQELLGGEQGELRPI